MSEHARNVESIYVEDLPQLIRLACKYRLRPDRAKEIVNQAIANVLAVGSPGDIENLRAFITATVRNLAIDEYRRQTRRRSKDAALRRDARIEDTHPSTESEYAAAQTLGPMIERILKARSRKRK